MYLKREQTLTLSGSLSSGGDEFKLMLQRVATADPLEGAQVHNVKGSSLTIAGTTYPGLYAGGVSLAVSDAVSLDLSQADVSRAVGGDFSAELVLLVATAGVWSVAAQWSLDVDIHSSPFFHKLVRGAENRLLLSVTAYDENATRCTLGNGLEPPLYQQLAAQDWSGVRNMLTGGKSWYFVLDKDLTGLSIAVEDLAGNVLQKEVTVPAKTPSYPGSGTPRWNLPPWLKDEGHTADVLAAIHKGTPNIDETYKQVSPVEASGEYLDEHAPAYGVTRNRGEGDSSLRLRALAVLTGHFSSRDGLQEHLSAVAGTEVRISDSTTGVNEGWVRLDGSHQLDATWNLGGIGAALTPGSYLVRFASSPAVPLSWVLDELQRLRPVGILPDVTHIRMITGGVNRAIVANREWAVV